MVTPLFPMTYQNEYEEWEPNVRVPKTTSDSPLSTGSSRVGISSGEYSRSASQMIM